jgi:hypothetical protein
MQVVHALLYSMLSDADRKLPTTFFEDVALTGASE